MQPWRVKLAGFTLIELMIVLAVLSILLIIAVPIYQDYASRAKVSEAFALSSAAKTAVSETVIANSAWPYDNQSAGLPAKTSIIGTYVQSIEILPAGKIKVTMASAPILNSDLADKLVVLQATLSKGSVSWTCSSDTTVAVRFLPPICR